MTNAFDNVRALWNKEQIRILVMVSLIMQIILIVFAPLRKRSANKKLMVLLWSVYLGADYVATLALGSILAHTMENVLDSHSGVGLVPLWAPFLLLHLGGPDNITSYSVEDNELWLRHFLSFIVQVSVASMVLLLSNLQRTKFLVPSVLIFLVRILKFGERTLALRAATKEQLPRSFLKLQPFGYEMLDSPALEQRRSSHPFDLAYIDFPGIFRENEFVLRCYSSFWRKFSNMIGTQGMSRLLLPSVWKYTDFEEIGMELSFFYDILHTKVTVNYSAKGRWARLVSLVLIPIALISFHNSEKWNHDSSDLIITYILFVMALLLEIYSVLLFVASNLIIVSFFCIETKWSIDLAKFIDRAKNHIFPRRHKQRWSGHMGQYTLQQEWVRHIEEITIQREKTSHMIIWIRKKLNSLKHAWHSLFEDEQRVEVSKTLEKMMFQHVGDLVEGIHDYYELAKKLRSSWIVNTIVFYKPHLSGSSEDLMRGISFDECVMSWHLVTEIFYFASIHTDGPDTEREDIYRVSKYMMHLLFKQSSMMPPGIAKMTSTRTISTLDTTYFQMPTDSVGRDLRHVLCEYFSTVDPRNIFLNMITMTGRSVCPITFVLLEDLINIGNSGVRWQVMRNAWMEMLTFTALRCSTTEHAKALSRGGELLTLHWMLIKFTNVGI